MVSIWSLAVLRRLTKVAGWLLAVIGFGLMAVFAGVRSAPAIQLLSVQSNSMAPLIRKGDAVVVSRQSLNRLRSGDIISYRSQSGVVITHRLLAVDAAKGQLLTKGDANASNDAPVYTQQVIGRADRRLPGVGIMIDRLRMPQALLVAVYIPASLIVWLEFRRLASHYRRPTYLAYRRS